MPRRRNARRPGASVRGAALHGDGPPRTLGRPAGRRAAAGEWIVGVHQRARVDQPKLAKNRRRRLVVGEAEQKVLGAGRSAPAGERRADRIRQTRSLAADRGTRPRTRSPPRPSRARIAAWIAPAETPALSRRPRHFRSAGRKQQMRGLHDRPPEHPRFVLGEPDHVVALVCERADRVEVEDVGAGLGGIAAGGCDAPATRRAWVYFSPVTAIRARMARFAARSPVMSAPVPVAVHASRP